MAKVKSYIVYVVEPEADEGLLLVGVFANKKLANKAVKIHSKNTSEDPSKYSFDVVNTNEVLYRTP